MKFIPVYAIASIMKKWIEIKPFFKITALKKPMVLYTFFLILLLPFVLIEGVYASEKKGAAIAIITFYFLTALAGLLMYRFQEKKVHFLTQIGFLSIAEISLFSDSFGSFLLFICDYHTILFLASYSYLIFFILFIFLNKIKPKKWQIISSCTLITLLFLIIIIIVVYAAFRKGPAYFNFSSVVILTLGYFSSLLSIIYFKKIGIKKRYLVFFQAAFFCILLRFVLLYILPIPDMYIHQELTIYYTWGGVIITSIALVWLVIDHFFITFLRRKLVAKPAAVATSKPISIYPEASNYIDVHSKAAWLGKFIRNSDGGVIGLTGVRGAGKSALLNKIISQFDSECFTLHITSPVHSSDRMEFFMMVCKEVCSSVIKEIENKIFRFKNTALEKAKEGLTSKIRLLLLFLLIITAGILFFRPFNFFNGPASLGSTGENERLLNYYLDVTSFPRWFFRQADKRSIEALLRRIDGYLVQKESIFNSMVIAPQTNRDYFTILPITDNNVNLQKIFKISIKKFRTEFESRRRRRNESVITYLSKENKLDKYAFAAIYCSFMTATLESQIKGFINRRGDITEAGKLLRKNLESLKEIAYKFLLKGREFWFNDIFGDRYGSKTYRNYLTTDAVGKMFKINGSFDDSSKLMSWVLLEAFFTHAPTNEKNNLLLDRENRARQLRDHLAAYLDVLHGVKQTRQTTLKNPANEKTGLLYSTSFRIFCIIAFLLLTGNFLIRWSSFFMASIVNFKVFGLWLRSKDFLKLLTYSESREKGGTFSLSKAMSVSLRRKQTERDLTLSALTNRFIEYIKEVSELFNQKMIICIDELDKMDNPEDVKQILREIKGALFVKNSYYLISISQDAAHSFQNRLSVGRDIFESTFDELIMLKRLDSRQTWEIIKKRLHSGETQTSEAEEKMKINAAALALMAGGIPREIIRNLRETLLQYNRFDQVHPHEICIFLFQRKIDGFIQNIGTVPITGEQSLDLYNTLKEIKLKLAKPAKVTSRSIKEVIESLEKCIGIVDPEQLYLKVTTGSAETEKASYDAIVDEIKKLVELIIIAEVLSQFKKKKAGARIDEKFQQKIFSCYNTLEGNPALAKHILYA